jgi:RNA polymerase sigma factor (sigma-70 family)
MSIDWETFVSNDAKRIYRYFAARFDAHTANDLVQEVLIRLVSKVRSGEYDESRGALIVFAFGIAHFVAREHCTSRRKKSLASVSSENDGIETAVFQGDDAEKLFAYSQRSENLRRAIKDLPMIEQEVLALLVDRELTMPEIASVLALPIGTIKSHVHRAKMRLRSSSFLQN